MRKNIMSIKELEEEQEKLKMAMTITATEFKKSIASNKTEIKDFLLKKVVLPSGALGLAYSTFNHFSSKKKSKHSSNSILDFAKPLMPIGAMILKEYMEKDQQVTP